MATKRKPIVGRRFGRLIAIKRVERVNGFNKFRCKCDCGNETIVWGPSLSNGCTKSCGCLHLETAAAQGRAMYQHGMCYSAEYRTWHYMKMRCLNSTYSDFAAYGGRGITICSQWLNSFETFYNDVGPRPSSNHSIDRIDVNGNYEPGNVRWATPLEQGRNKRNTRMLEINGESKTIGEWAEITGIRYQTIWNRLKYGWSSRDAVYGRSHENR
jgi:hypothetical protein